MLKKDIITEIIEKNGGYIKTSEILSNDISKPYFFNFVDKNNLIRVAHGIYITPDTWEDHIYILQLRYPNAIFSHETAAYLLGLSEREPQQISLTVVAGTSSTRLNKEGVKVYKIKQELFEVGLFSSLSPTGHTIRAYDAERTVCDYFRNRTTIESQELQAVVKSYLQLSNRNISKLMRYAKKLSVDNIMRTYMEGLL